MGSIAEVILEYTFAAVDKITRPASQVVALANIASAFYAAGQASRGEEILDLAIGKLNLIKRPEEKAELLAWMGGLSAQSGNKSKSTELFNRAVLLARATETPRQKIDALQMIASEMVEAGLIDEASQVVSELCTAAISGDKPDDVVADLVDIADIYYVMGQKENTENILAEAQQKITEIKDEWLKAERLMDIVEELAFTGFIHKAVQLLEESVLNPGIIGINRPYFLLRIVGVYFSAGNKAKGQEILNQTLETINQDEPAYSRSQDLTEIAGRYLQSGERRKAADLIDQSQSIMVTITDAKDRIESMIAISGILEKIAETRGALELVNKAEDLSHSIQDIQTRVYLLGKILLRYINLKDQPEVRKIESEIVKLVQGGKTRTAGLSSLIEDLTEAGEISLGLRLAAIIREPECKVRVLTEIAARLIESKPAGMEEINQAFHDLITRSSA